MNLEQCAPTLLGKSFACPHCSAFAQQRWYPCYINGEKHLTNPQGQEKIFLRENPLSLTSNCRGYVNAAECLVCNQISLWIGERLVFPMSYQHIPKPNSDLPNNVRELYVEAARIADESSRGAVALLRLCLQILLNSLNDITGKDIYEKIGNLVGKVPEQILKSCESVRVYGNNAVHPGTIQLDDKKEIVFTLFNLINYIATHFISMKKQANSIFDNLPETVKKNIAERDKTKTLKEANLT